MTRYRRHVRVPQTPKPSHQLILSDERQDEYPDKPTANTHTRSLIRIQKSRLFHWLARSFVRLQLSVPTLELLQHGTRNGWLLSQMPFAVENLHLSRWAREKNMYVGNSKREESQRMKDLMIEINKQDNKCFKSKRIRKSMFE